MRTRDLSLLAAMAVYPVELGLWAAPLADPCWTEAPVAAPVVHRARTLAMRSDSAAVSLRRTLDLPALSDSSMVMLVRDTSTCRSVLEGVRIVHDESARVLLTRVVVVSVGPTRYLASVGTSSPRGPVTFVLDQQFRAYISF